MKLGSVFSDKFILKYGHTGHFLKNSFLLLFFSCMFSSLHAQTFYVPPVTVPPGGQTCLNFNVTGNYPPLIDPYLGPWPGMFLDYVEINILTSHPWTMEITLTSPAGTTIVLSSFNGAGGTNYTNTNFTQFTANSIVGAAAPFTGNFLPESSPPGFYEFNNESITGLWQLCITDTLTDTTSYPPGGPIGIGATSSASGTMGFGSAPCDPLALNPPFINDNTFAVCNGTVIDLNTYYIPPPGYIVSYYDAMGIQVGSSISAPGTYYVVMEHYCWAVYSPGLFSSSAIVTLTGTQASLGPDQSVTVCQGVPTNLNALFNLSGFTYQWDLNGVPITSANASAVILPGTYQLIGNDPGSCPDTALVTISIQPGPSLGPDVIVGGCPVAPFDLTSLYITTGLTVSWYLGITPIANASSVSTNGLYQLVVSDATGCTDTAFVTLNFTPGPALGPDQSIDFCGSSPVNLTTLYNTTGFNASWTLNGNNVVNPSSAVMPGLYTLIASNANGCADTASVTLNLLSTPALGPSLTISGCTAGTYDLTTLFNTTGLITSWTLNGNPVSNPSSVMVNGNYLLMAENALGCTDTAFVALNLSVGPVLGANQVINNCSGSSVNLTTLFTTGSFSTSWTVNGIPVVNPSAVTNSGVYTLIASNANGCADTVQATLTFYPLPTLGADQMHDLCSNQTLDLTQLYPVPGLITTWTLNGNPVGNPSGISAPGNYNLLVTDVNGCTDQAVVTITSLPAPALGPNLTAGYCPGATTDISALFNTTGFIATWTLSGGSPGNINMINTPGNYQLVAVAANGCSDTALVVVSASSFPVLGPDQQMTRCDGEIVNLGTIFNTGTNSTSWTENGIPVTNPSAVITDGIFQVVCTNSAGCSSTASVTINFNPSPQLGSNQNLSICGGTTADLTPLYNLSNLNATWSLNGIPVTNPGSVSNAGSYQLVALNAFNCPDTAMVSLIVNSLPSLGPDTNFVLCPWVNVDLLSLYNLSGLTYSWTLNGQQVQNIATVHDSGYYQLSVTDQNGCTSTADVTINNIECECLVDFTYEGRCKNEPVIFNVFADSAITSVQWTFHHPLMQSSTLLSPTTVFPTNESILVTLEAEVACGLITVEKNIKMENCADSCGVYIPNVFTPNQDGKNEGFHTYSECSPLEYEMEIRNRFGELVFTSANYFSAWKGDNAPEGVYVFQVTYKMPYQSKKLVTGRISLLR